MSQAITCCGHQVFIFCTSKHSRIFIKNYWINNVNIIEFPDLFWGKLRQGLDLWNSIRRIFYSARLNIDLMYAIDCRPTVIFPALFLKKIRKKPLILGWWDLFGQGGTIFQRSSKVYSLTAGKIEFFFEEYFRKYADHAIVVSSFLKAKLESQGYPSKKISIIRVGCWIEDLTKFDKFYLRNKLNIIDNRSILCFIGTLFEKDKNLLISALRILKNIKIKMPTTIIIGNSKIEPKICIELAIYHLGTINSFDNVKKILFSCDYALIPMTINNANIARWPSKAADYWALGLPVIATPISDYSKLFSIYNLGFLAKDDTPDSFANAIINAINSSSNDINIKRDAIMRYVKTELAWPMIAKQLNILYTQLR